MAKTRNASRGPSQRQLSVGETVRHALTAVLQRGDLDDPALGGAIVSVTEVRMSPDLKLATAYVAVMGVEDVAPYADALNRNAKFLRGRLTPSLRQMKYMPEIRFRPDESFDNYARIDALLRSPEVARDLREDDERDGGDGAGR